MVPPPPTPANQETWAIPQDIRNGNKEMDTIYAIVIACFLVWIIDTNITAHKTIEKIITLEKIIEQLNEDDNPTLE